MSIEFKTIPHGSKYLAIARNEGARSWQKVRDKHNKLVVHETASQAINAAKDIFGIARETYQVAACPTPAKPLTPEQRAFYDKRAEQMSNTRHIQKRKRVVTVISRAGKTIKKIGELK